MPRGEKKQERSDADFKLNHKVTKKVLHEIGYSNIPES